MLKDNPKNKKILKKLLFLIVFCSFFDLSAQYPTGKLFVHTQKSSFNEKDVFGIVSYYPPVYTVIDSTELTDMMTYDSRIYIANNNIIIYDIQTIQKIDSVVNTDALYLCEWNDRLITACQSPPYFRVYDILNNHNLEYVIDTSKINNMPMDIIVSGDWAILAIDTNLVIIDLLIKDTLAYVGIDAPLKWAGYSSLLIEANNEVYVDLEYWTGAIRFSFVKLDKINLKTDSVFHVEMNMNVYRPQAVENRIYLTEYPSYYDTGTDSLYMLGFYSPFVIDHDTASDCIFVYDDVNKNILCYDDTTLINTFSLPKYLKMALWHNEETTSISSLDFPGYCEIFPVPARDYINIDFPGIIDHLKVYSINGELLISKQINGLNRINISTLPEGLYFIEITTPYNKYSGKFIKVE